MAKLIVGVNDLATTHPDLVSEALFDAGQYLPASNKDMPWRCDLGHEWMARIASRARQRAGCPYCTNRRALPGFNDLATTHPDLAREALFDASTVTAGSSAKLRWRCAAHGHEYLSRVGHRTGMCSGCPYCSGNRILPGFNDLATTHPDLAKEALFDATEVSAGSNKKLLWRCTTHGHIWDENPTNRTQKGYGCPYCSGNRTLPGFNDLATTHPDLAKEALFDATEVSAGSDQRLPWECSACEHTWHTPPKSRACGYETGCPECAEYGFKGSKQGACYLVFGNPGRDGLAIQFGKANTDSGQLGRRLRTHRRTGFTSELATVTFESGADATAMENRLKQVRKDFGVPHCTEDGVKFDGSTEAFFLTAESLPFAEWLCGEFGIPIPAGWFSVVEAAA